MLTLSGDSLYCELQRVMEFLACTGQLRNLTTKLLQSSFYNWQACFLPPLHYLVPRWRTFGQLSTAYAFVLLNKLVNELPLQRCGKGSFFIEVRCHFCGAGGQIAGECQEAACGD